MLRFKNNAIRGGVIEHVYMRNVKAGQVARAAIDVDFYYEEGEKGPFTPVVRDVEVVNLEVKKCENAWSLRGFKNAPISDIRLKNCTFEGAAKAAVAENVEGLDAGERDGERQAGLKMKLPAGDRAIVDIRKLLDYCLNSQHPRVRNKARVFAAVGIRECDAEELRAALVVAARHGHAQPGVVNEFGRRYIIDLDLPRAGTVVKIRSTWIVRRDEDLPRLTSCYVL